MILTKFFAKSLLVDIFPPIVSEFSDPDITKANGFPMILQHNGATSVRLDPGATPRDRFPLNRGVELDHDAVMQYSDVGRAEYLPVFVEVGCGENDVKSLPLSRWSGDVDERHGLLVNRPRLAIGIGEVLIAIQYLQLVHSLNDDAAVAAILAAS